MYHNIVLIYLIHTYYTHNIFTQPPLLTLLLGWLGTHVRGIVSIRLEILTETTVLLLDSVLNIN